MKRLPRLVPALFSLALSLPAQTGPVNLDFHEIAIEGKPPGWSWTANASYSATILDDCRTPNTRCVLFHSQTGRVPSGGGMFLQSFDATAFRGKQVRYRAWLRLEALCCAQLFLRVDRPSGAGFRGYSPNSKAASSGWTLHEVEAKIDSDAKRITIGMILNGLGAAAIAGQQFETVAP
jgi:hypothetical protein